jgi:hypothetical protein
LLCLVGCTDDDQAKEVARQKRIEAQEQAEQQANQQNSQATPDTSSAPVEVAQNEAPAEPEKPAAPETRTVTTYHFHSAEYGERNCDNSGKESACGVSFESCGSNDRDRDEDYFCLTNVKVWSTSKEELVKDN